MLRRLLRPTCARPSLVALLATAVLVAPDASAQQGDSGAAKPPAAGPVWDSMPSPAEAAKFGTMPARWLFGVGGYLPHINTTLQLGTKNFSGSEINLENKLGLTPSTQSIDLLAAYRIDRKSYVSLEFFDFNRSAGRTLTDSLVVNDTVYHAGVTVDTKAKLQYYGLTYRYYIWRRYRWKLGAGLGIDVMNAGFGLGIKASVQGNADSAQTSGSIVAPVPMIGFYGDWEVFPRIILRGEFQTLYIANVASYSGSVKDRRIAAEWYPLSNYGIGLGWHYVGLDVKKTGSNGGFVQADYSIQGISLYAAAAFGAPEPIPPRPSKFRAEPPRGQDFGLVPRDFSISIGGYLPGVNSIARLSTPTDTGTGVDLESRLGLPSKTQSLVIDAAVRIGDRSLITGSYFGFTRTGSATIADTIHFGGNTYDPGATLNAKGVVDYFGFSYRYYFLREKKWQIGGGIGLDELDLSTSMGIKASIAGKEDSLKRTNNLSAPAPMLGLYADWEFIPRFYLRGQGEYLSATITNVSVAATDDRAAVEWYALDNYGVGLGYHYVGLKVSDTFRNSDVIKLKYTINGFYLYLTAAW